MVELFWENLQLGKLPPGYIDAAKREALIERECARSQLEYLSKARISLALSASLEERAHLEEESKRRFDNAEVHIRIATQQLFDAYAGGCWHLVRPNAAKFSEILPAICGQVGREMECPELTSMIGATLDKQRAKWETRTVFQGGITNAVRWAELRGKFQSLANQESPGSKKPTRQLDLCALCDYTTSLIETGSWILTGAEHGIRVLFELHGAEAGLTLGGDGVIDPLSFWLHRLFIDLLENRSPQASGHRGKDAYIRRVCIGSATFCASLEKVAMENEQRSATLQLGSADEKMQQDQRDTPLLNLELIGKWMREEGYENKDLATALKVSIRTVSSLRNNGSYHGAGAITKLANLMNRTVEDLYLP